MIGRNWLYYILDQNGNSYYVENGQVKLSNIPRPLQYTPDGWQKLLIGWERNWNYYGVNRNVTNPLSYVKDGAQIMRDIFYSNNIEVKAYLLIQKKGLNLSSTEFSYVYQYWYKGENDFSSFQQVDISGGYKVTCSIAEGGFAKFLKAYNSTTYEIPCNETEPTAVKVRMDGLPFYNKMNFVIPAVSYDRIAQRFLVPLAFQNEEGDSVGLYKGNQDFLGLPIEENKEPDILSKATDFFISSVNQITLTPVAGKVTIRNDEELYNIVANVYFKTSLGNRYPLFENLTIPVNGSHIEDFSVNIPLAPGENLFLVCHAYSLVYFTGNALPTQIDPKIEFLETNFSVTTTTKLAPTICYARRPKHVFQGLVDGMTSKTYKVSSTLLDANKNVVITSGKAVRGFKDAVIKTTHENFFKTERILNMAGLEYNDVLKTVEIESIAKYFDASNPIYLGEVRKLKVSLLKDQLFNVLNIGYPNKDYDTVNGLKEFNTTEQFSSIITRISKTLDMVIPYRADSYGIEIARKDYQNLDTTDSSSDDDAILLDIEDTPDADGIYNLARPPYSNISGVILDSSNKYGVFNTRISPKNLLLRNAPLLHSLLYGFDTTSLKFQTTNKNPALSATLNGKTIVEATDVLIGELDNILFKPVVFDFEPEPYNGLINLMDANVNRCFSFKYNGVIYKGFNLKIGVAPNDNEIQGFQLLSSADNDLTQLIKESNG